MTMDKKDAAYEKESFYQDPKFPGVTFINLDAGGIPRTDDEAESEDQTPVPDTNG